jgi:hypothetical protein
MLTRRRCAAGGGGTEQTDCKEVAVPHINRMCPSLSPSPAQQDVPRTRFKGAGSESAAQQADVSKPSYNLRPTAAPLRDALFFYPGDRSQTTAALAGKQGPPQTGGEAALSRCKPCGQLRSPDPEELNVGSGPRGSASAVMERPADAEAASGEIEYRQEGFVEVFAEDDWCVSL